MLAIGRVDPGQAILDAPFQRMRFRRTDLHDSFFSRRACAGLHFPRRSLQCRLYKELVLSFFMIVAGFLPLVWLGWKNAVAWHGLTQKLQSCRLYALVGPGVGTRLQIVLRRMVRPVRGLGFVISFGLLVHDFLVVQRAEGRGLDETAA